MSSSDILLRSKYKLGKQLIEGGRYEEARSVYEQICARRKNDADSWFMLGTINGILKRHADAANCCSKAVELSPDHAAAWYNLGVALRDLGQNKAAANALGKVLALNPAHEGAATSLGHILVALHRYDEAEETFRRILNHQPGNAEFYAAYGSAMQAMGRYETAVKMYRMAIELQPPGSADLHFILGECFQKQKLPDRAVTCFRKAITIDKHHKEAHYSLASLYSIMNRHEESAKHFVEILRLNPNDEQARHLLAAQQGKTTVTAPAAYVVTLFDGYADNFDTKLAELGYNTPELLHEMVSQHVTLAPSSQDIIDLGCGTGLCAPLFRDSARTLHGVDLSPGMIEKARTRGMYDELEVGDIVTSLVHREAAWDLAICTDVFIYVGALLDVFNACARALRPGGWFAFSVEAGDDTETYVLRDTGRYAHSIKYIHNLALETGFSEVACQPVILRKDKRSVDIHGHLFLLRRSDAVYR